MWTRLVNLYNFKVAKRGSSSWGVPVNARMQPIPLFADFSKSMSWWGGKLLDAEHLFSVRTSTRPSYPWLYNTGASMTLQDRRTLCPQLPMFYPTVPASTFDIPEICRITLFTKAPLLFPKI